MLDITSIHRFLDTACCNFSSLALAVSGGSDSMALALLVKEWASRHNIRLVALTVDHALRNESTEEAETVHQWMQEWDIEHYILTWKGKKPKSNIQAVARDARYQLMYHFCKEQQIPALCTGHTKEDQAETFLLRLERASGIYGLSGIQETSAYQNLPLLRPLLHHHRKDLRTYLKDHKQAWVEDPSNENMNFDRVKIRKWIAEHPNSDHLTNQIVQTTSHLLRARNFFEEEIKRFYTEHVTFTAQGYAFLDITNFLALHPELQLRFLQHIIPQISGQNTPPRFTKIQTLHQQLIDRDFNAATLHGCQLFKGKKQKELNRLYIIREHQDITDKPLVLTPNQPAIWDNRFKITPHNTKSPLKVAKLSRSDYTPIKNHLEKSDIVLPQKILLSLPAIYTLEKLLSVPHIDYYSSTADAKVDVELIKNNTAVL